VLLSRCLEESLAILSRTLDPRIHIQVQAAPDLWQVHADPNQLGQVLINLCLNSRDAMPQGGQIVIEMDNVVRAAHQVQHQLDARPGNFVRLRVRDTGEGIPPEVLPRIFEPFFTTKDPGKGTGLGLSTVFGIIKQHQGWIECRSPPGQGAVFDIYLPRFRDG
jgi:signal transduction histidine kinase